MPTRPRPSRRAAETRARLADNPLAVAFLSLAALAREAARARASPSLTRRRSGALPALRRVRARRHSRASRARTRRPHSRRHRRRRRRPPRRSAAFARAFDAFDDVRDEDGVSAPLPTTPSSRRAPARARQGPARARSAPSCRDRSRCARMTRRRRHARRRASRRWDVPSSLSGRRRAASAARRPRRPRRRRSGAAERLSMAEFDASRAETPTAAARLISTSSSASARATRGDAPPRRRRRRRRRARGRCGSALRRVARVVNDDAEDGAASTMGAVENERSCRREWRATRAAARAPALERHQHAARALERARARARRRAKTIGEAEAQHARGDLLGDAPRSRRRRGRPGR